MKVYLSGYTEEKVAGYENFMFPEIFEIVDGSVHELYCESGLLNSFDQNELEAYLPTILKKVEIGGRIILSGIDFILLCKDVSLELVNRTDLHKTVEMMLSALSYIDVKNTLIRSGFIIDRIELNGHEFIIEATRD